MQRIFVLLTDHNWEALLVPFNVPGAKAKQCCESTGRQWAIFRVRAGRGKGEGRD